MSKSLRVLFVLGLLGLVATIGSSAAGATKADGESVTIATDGQLTGADSVEGTWRASGAIEASGTYTERFQIVGNTIHGIKTLVGAEGMIVLAVDAQISVSDSSIATFSGGAWSIVYGTGAYARLHAGGKPGTTPDSTGNLVTGEVHVVHVGRVRDD